MLEEPTPMTEPAGALVPPSRRPPTAVGTAEMPFPEGYEIHRRDRRPSLGARLRKLAIRVLDVADAVADFVVHREPPRGGTRPG